MSRTQNPTTRPPSNRRIFARRIERRVLDHIHANSILVAGESVIVAVSGGPDSTALLAILHELAPALDISLTTAHFNHRLRSPAEAAADLEYVAAFASQLRLPFVHGAGDVRARSRKRRESVEEAARALRYSFLAREAKRAGAGVVVTGHTLNDQAETVLLHIARGAGVDGVASMRGRSKWPFVRGPALARPLLCLSRGDIERYCRELRLQPCRDETNEHLTAIRNRIRLRVLPELEAINPGIAEALSRLAAASASDADYLDGMAKETFKELAIVSGGCVSLLRTDLRALPPSIAARVVRAAIKRVAGTTNDIERIHVEAVLALADQKPGQLSLPHAVSVWSDSQSLHVRHGPKIVSSRIPDAALSVPGVTHAGPWSICCEFVARPDPPARPSRFEAYFNRELTQSGFIVRSRRPGDRLHPIGLGGGKKVQDILVDAKVPINERNGVPLICDDAGILWVVGHCLDERARVRADAKEVLHITIRPKI